MGLVKAGFVACSIMAVIYGFLAYSGATSVTTLGLAKNGGITMAQMNAFYFGNVGAILLAIIVTLACLKTCVGLIGACGETFDEMFPNTLGYRGYAYLTTAVGFLIANVGLTKIIELAIPVLMFLYPLSITIILLSFAAPIFKGRQAVYAWTTAFALFVMLWQQHQHLSINLDLSNGRCHITECFHLLLSVWAGLCRPLSVSLSVWCISH